MLPELTHEEIAAGLDAVAAETLEGANFSRPPVDAVALARALGLSVSTDETQLGRARMVRLRQRRGQPRGSILVRPDPRTERLQWAVAHEIGEHLAVRAFHELGMNAREAAPGTREKVANQLAGRLLLPRAWFGSEAASCGWDLAKLKQEFVTASHELIARRMLDFSLPIAITIFDHGQVTFRRGNVPGRVPPLGELERACWHEAHSSGQAQRDADAFAAVQAWPVHEADWKREILRTEWDLEALPGLSINR